MTFDAVCKFADTATVITEGINVAATEVTAEQTSTTATYAFAMNIFREWDYSVFLLLLYNDS